MIDAEQSWLQAAIDNEVYNLQVSKRLQPSVGLQWRNTRPRRSDLVDCEDGTKSVRTVMKGKATFDSTRGAPSDTWSQICDMPPCLLPVRVFPSPSSSWSSTGSSPRSSRRTSAT